MITAFYAALLGLGLIWMSWRVIAQRREMRVSLGDGGDKVLVKRIRAHANFVEYVPLGLILLALVEWHWKLPWLAHGVGATLLIGRVLHAVAFSGKMNFVLRSTGMVLTGASLFLASTALLTFVISAWLA